MTTPVYTIGHSTRPIEEFLAILDAFHIETVVDVRTIARSRHNPQFGEEALTESLAQHGLSYKRIEALGGLRHGAATSINKAWRNPSFRAYADYMQTAQFAAGMDELLGIANESRTVIMCAEAVPWRCHRSLIGDALLVRGLQVEDIMSEKSTRPHVLTPWAKVDGETITYPEVKNEDIA
ncbi:MAG: DUF488 domain-containing protein [Candidatus Promineofilum sp.]|nr:DUF488 domain-containing protein [Promineifilum sp.]